MAKWTNTGRIVGPKGPKGDSLEYKWQDTKLGIRQEGDTSYTYSDLEGPRGPKGDTGPQGDRGPKGDTVTGATLDEAKNSMLIGGSKLMVWGEVKIVRTSATTFRKTFKIDSDFPAGVSGFSGVPYFIGVVSDTSNVTTSSSYLTGVQINNLYTDGAEIQVRKSYTESDLGPDDSVSVHYLFIGNI